MRTLSLFLCGVCALSQAGAQSVIELSQLDGANGVFFQGRTTEDFTGAWVDTAGDFNGDGIDDIVIGAFEADRLSEDSGLAYLLFGSATYQNFMQPDEFLLAGNPFNLGALDGGLASAGFAMYGEESSLAGLRVKPLGDVNGDELDDIIVGTVGVGAWVVYGRRVAPEAPIELASLTSTVGFRLTGGPVSDRLGRFVSGVGDFNDDGRPDIAIGAPDAAGGAGRVYIVYGREDDFPNPFDVTSVSGTDGFVLIGDDPTASLGFLSAAGDVNDDGVDDLLVTSPLGQDSQGVRAGKLFVVFGNRDGFPPEVSLGDISGDAGFVVVGEAQDDQAGFNVRDVGDFNGDGVDDFLVSTTSLEAGGFVYLIFGSAQGFPDVFDLANINGINGVRFDGSPTARVVGRVSGAGDFNDDGLNDIIIGTDGEPNGMQSGQSFLLFGRRATLPRTIALDGIGSSDGVVINGWGPGDSASVVDFAGDFNDDGIGDVLIGARGANFRGMFPGGFDGGTTFVVFGRAELIFADGMEAPVSPPAGR